MEAKEVNITYEVLFELLKREKDTADLQKLEPNFFNDFVDYLNEIGYKNWTALNNYGVIIFENKSYTDILNLIKSETKNKIVIDIYCK